MLYESGMKLRNPCGSKARFVWKQGNARLPWRCHFAARPEVKTVFVCEGETDVLAALAAGLEVLHPKQGQPASEVVACPGTAFREAWGPLFSGKRAVLLFDGDEAGRLAARRTAAILGEYALSVCVAGWEGGDS
jgi:DNA primase